MAVKDNKHAGYLKYMSLLTLTIQNTLLIISMRYSRVQGGPMYITTTAVVFSEATKMIICLIVIFYQEGATLKNFTSHLHEAIIVNWKDTLKMSVPALVYMIQNNLQYVAVSNLEAAVFQVTYQLKILTTALFSVIMLNKKLSGLQWSSLVILFVGVALVQVQGTSSSSSSSTTSESSRHQNQLLGLGAVIISCLSSGFAGVYFEKMLKGSNASVWLRNVQLGMFGTITAIIGMFISSYSDIKERGFFVGYSFLVVTVISQQAVGGLIVAMVVRYADNILKGFATSLSIILSCIASVYLFDYVISLQFCIGAFLVIAAIYVYGRPSPSQSSSTLLPAATGKPNSNSVPSDGNTNKPTATNS